VVNSGYQNLVSESEGDVEEKAISTDFTLAEVSPADIHLKPLKSPLQSEPTIDLVPVSKSRLEIVETGFKELWSPENPAIALFVCPN